MSAIFRKTAKGEIEVQVASDGSPVLLGRSFRMVEGMRVDLAHWLDATRAIVWIALRNPCLRLLDNQDDPQSFGCTDDGDLTSSRLVSYQGVVLLHIPDINYSSEPRVYLLDLTGWALAGSNVYDSAHNLCLGEAFNPLTLQAAELLMHNEANSDLYWSGHLLDGEYINHTFEISTWPTLSHIYTPPDAILADIRRWWPT